MTNQTYIREPAVRRQTNILAHFTGQKLAVRSKIGVKRLKLGRRDLRPSHGGRFVCNTVAGVVRGNLVRLACLE